MNILYMKKSKRQTKKTKKDSKLKFKRFLIVNKDCNVKDEDDINSTLNTDDAYLSLEGAQEAADMDQIVVEVECKVIRCFKHAGWTEMK